jgi:hypothetical protein
MTIRTMIAKAIAALARTTGIAQGAAAGRVWRFVPGLSLHGGQGLKHLPVRASAERAACARYLADVRMRAYLSARAGRQGLC